MKMQGVKPQGVEAKISQTPVAAGQKYASHLEAKDQKLTSCHPRLQWDLLHLATKGGGVEAAEGPHGGQPSSRPSRWARNQKAQINRNIATTKGEQPTPQTKSLPFEGKEIKNRTLQKDSRCNQHNRLLRGLEGAVTRTQEISDEIKGKRLQKGIN